MNDIILTITLTSQGIQVGGPINDKVLCLGMMELAKKSVIDYQPQTIQVAPASILAST